MKIYSSAGSVLLDIEVDDGSYAYREIMGRDDLTLYFALTSFVEIPVGSYCVFQNVTYYLLKPESLTLRHTRNWEYTLTMETYAGLLQTAIYQNPDDRRLKFFVTGPAATHLDLLVRCLNGKRSGWSYESTVDTSLEKTVGYDFGNCKEALQLIADGFETEWEIIGKKIVLGKVEHGKATPVSMSYGKGNGFLPGVERRNYNDEIPLSRLFVQGGDRNIVFSRYGSKTLMMPKGVTVGYDGEKFSWEGGYSQSKAKTFTTDSDGASVSLVGATSECDGALDCSEIYPKRVGTVSEVIVVDAKKNLYDFVDNTIPLTLDYAECATSETMTVIFQTGALAGREFDVAFTKRKADVVVNRFKIAPATIDEVDMPSSSFAPVAGDKYIAFHCSLPQSYINDPDTHTGAEWDVLRKAVAYLWDSCRPRFSISGKMDGIWSRLRWDSIGGNIVPGGYISFTDERFSPEAFSVRITAVTQFVNRPYSPEITLSNEPTRGGVVSSIREVRGDVVTTQGDVYGGMNYTRRRYRDVKETTDALREALDSFDVDFDESIKPITVQTMQAVVGDDGLQYWFTENLTSDKEIDPPLAWNAAAKRMECGKSYVLHKTVGVTDVRADGSEGSRWTVSAATLTTDSDGNALDADSYYYLYIKAAANGTATFALMRKAMKMNGGDGSYNFLVGLLNSEYKGGRSFAPMYGFTEISPGRMTVNRIVSNDGETYFDLVNGVIGGNITFKAGSSGLENLSEWKGKQEQIDKALSDAGAAGSKADKASDEAGKARAAANAAKAAADSASSAVSKLGSDTVFALVEKRSVRETMQAISSIKGVIKQNPGTVSGKAVSGAEWQNVTSAMAEAAPALSDFVGWRRSMIAGTANGYTVTRMDFSMGSACDVVVEFCSDGESRYDYLVAAAMDEPTELTKANADTLADVTTKGKQGIANKVTKTYSLTAGTHTLQIIYLKDGSGDTGTDSGYYRVLSESRGVILSGSGTYHAAHAEAVLHGLTAKAAGLTSKAVTLSTYLSGTCALWSDTDTALEETTPAFRETVYSLLRSYLEAQNDILSNAPVSDYEFLKKVFRDGSTTIAGGLVLTNMAAVTDIGSGAVTAGINGSDLGRDGAHGKLMMFAGSASASESDLKEAHTRIYEDGTLVTDRIQADGGRFNDVTVVGSIRNPFTTPSDSFDTDFSDNVAHLGGGGLTMAYTAPCNTSQSGRVIRVVNWKWDGSTQSGSSSIGLSDQSCAFLEDGIRKKEIYLSRECVTLLGYGDSARFYGWIVLQRTDLMTSKGYGRHMKVLAQGVINCGAKPTFGKYYTFDATTLSAERQSAGTFKVTLPAAWGLSDNGYVVLLTTLGRTSSNNVIVSSVKETRSGYFVFDCESVQANYIDDAKVMFLISNQSDFVNVANEVDKDTARTDPPGTAATGGGKLKITVTPESAAVVIDGAAVSVYGGSATVELSYGSHTVEVSAAGYKTQTLAVTVSEGTVTKTVALSEAELTGLSISGMQSISDTAQYTAVYSPSDVLSKYRGVTWSVVSGSAYATIDQNGVVSAKDGASSSVVVIRATSSYNTAIYAEKTISVTYAAGPEISFSDDVGGVINVRASDTSSVNRFQFANIGQLEASVTGSLSGASASVNDDGETSGEVRVTFAANTSSSERRGTVTVSGTRTDGKGTYSKSFTIVQAAAADTETYLRVTPATINAPADKTQFTNADGTLTIEANQSWTAEVTSGDDWLDIDAVDGTGDGTNGIILLESNTGSERTGTILFTGADGTAVTVVVTQEAAGESNSLPYGYAKIAGTGNGTGGSGGYIDTDFIVGSSDRVTLRMTRGGDLPQSCAFWGWRRAGNYLGSSQCYTNYNQSGGLFALTIGGPVKFGNVNYGNGEHELVIDFGQGAASLDGSAVSAESGSSFSFSNPFGPDGSAVYPAYLLAFNNIGTADSIAPNWYINGYTVERGGINVVNMVPAKRASDGTVGMYDTVRGRFFTSANSNRLVELQ
nr:MAG TPA: tail protein [Caudoviricetes sp.]